MATVTRPAAGYTPSNPITNSTKYQTDSAAIAPRVAISSVKVDGDLNKAFDVLSDHDNTLDDHEQRIDDLEAEPSTVPTSDVLFTASDKLLGRVTSGAGAGEEVTCTAFARTVLDDADAAAVRATIGVADASTSAAGIIEIATDGETRTGTATNLAVTPANLKASSLGMGQAYVDALGTSGRAFATDYTNNTGRPITVTVQYAGSGGNVELLATVGGVTIVLAITASINGARAVGTFVVPNGMVYNVTVSATATLQNWFELR